MLKKCVVFFLLFLFVMFSGCTESESNTIKIAVMGNEADFYPGYKEGIERAIDDLTGEYTDRGYTVECTFYNDDGSYEQGAATIDMLAADEAITGIIGAVDMEINKTAAHIFNEAGKLFIVPFYLYDSVYQENHYEMVFSLCCSAKQTGEILRRAAAETTAKRWAVCSVNREFERAELAGFLQYEGDDGVAVVDCTDISALTEQFDTVYARWEALGVEGVAMFPRDNEGFEILKKIKQRNPNMICAGDTSFDNSMLLYNDADLMSAMTGFIIADEFTLNMGTEEENELLLNMAEEYMQKTGSDLDTWYIQGYNAVRMVVDTAVKYQTTNPEEIARLLHENGYTGFFQRFSFDESGAQTENAAVYNMFAADGYAYEYTLNN